MPKLNQIKRIVLTGFMGSGKSTVGRLLAQQLDWSFIDLDSAVEERCGQTVPEVFAKHGENRFRSEESTALSVLMQRSSIVIALGGGAIETPSNRELLQQAERTAVVFLYASFRTLHDRCLFQASEPGATIRPLFAVDTVAQARYQARQPHYEAVASLRLDTTQLTPEDAVTEVLRQLG